MISDTRITYIFKIKKVDGCLFTFIYPDNGVKSNLLYINTEIFVLIRQVVFIMVIED